MDKIEKWRGAETPECWGNFGASDDCLKCEFFDSCKFHIEESANGKKDSSRWNNRAVEYSEEIGDCDCVEFPIDLSDDDQTYSKSDMITALSFVLRLKSDDKITEFLTKRIEDDKSFSDIAKDDGVSRQAVHLRIGRAIEKLFGYKQRRVKDSSLLRLTAKEFEIYVLRMDGFSCRETAKMLGISKDKVWRLRQALDTKIGKKRDTNKGNDKKNKKKILC